MLFWNSIDTSYHRSAGPIPEITKENKKYRIHHIAFVEKINYADGTIDVVESNGSQGVTKNTINVADWLTNKKEKNSELYIGSINYNVLSEKEQQEKKAA